MTASQACRPPSGNSGSSSTPATETIFSSVGFSAINMVEALAGVDMTGWRKEKETSPGESRARRWFIKALRGVRNLEKLKHRLKKPGRSRRHVNHQAQTGHRSNIVPPPGSSDLEVSPPGTRRRPKRERGIKLRLAENTREYSTGSLATA